MNITDNPKQKKQLETEQVKLYGFIDGYKKYMEEFNRDKQNVQFVKDAVELYDNEITPLLEKTMKLKYQFVDVESIGEGADMEYRLIEKHIATENLEFGNDYKVISLKTGTM